MRIAEILCTLASLLWVESEPHIKAASTAYESGRSQTAAGDWAAAERSFLRAIDIEPTWSEGYRSLIHVYVATSRPLEASMMLTRFLQIEPKSVTERLQLGRLLLDQQQWSRALAQFSIAMKIDSRNADAVYWFAYAAGRNDMRQTALNALAQAVRNFPHDDRFSKLAAALAEGRVEARAESPTQK